MRALWWRGIPSNLRGTLWEQAIGNSIALSKGVCGYVPHGDG